MKRPVVNSLLALTVCVSGLAFNASAQERRVEYRYPDRPDLVFTDAGVRAADDPDRPMAFSNFQSAVSVADAQSVMGQRYDSYISELPRRVAPRASATTSLSSSAVVSERSAPVIAPEPQMAAYSPTPAAPVAGDFSIQAGAFSSYANADRLAVQLRDFADARVVEGVSNGRTVYRVMLGGWVNREQAMPMLDLMKARGFDGFVTRAS